MNLGDHIRAFFKDVGRLFSLIFDMGRGFFDEGESFYKGLEILKDEGLYDVISDKTIDMIDTEVDTLMKKHNFAEGQKILIDYLDERKNNFANEHNPLKDFEMIFGGALVTVLTMPGKLSLVSPIITALLPTIATWQLTLAQLIMNILINKWWAGGNLLLLFFQAEHILMQVCMMMLLSDINFYLYGLRILRYLVFAWCIFFNLAYIAMAGGVVDQVFVNGWYLEKEDF